MVEPVIAPIKSTLSAVRGPLQRDSYMNGDRWSAEDDAELLRLVDIGTKTAAIARQLNRSQAGIFARMAALGSYRRRGDRKVSGAAAEHIRVVERRLIKAVNRAALALAAADAPAKRGRGRPPASAKESVMLPIDKVVLDHFRDDGPGWEKRINDALRKVLGL